MDTISLTKAKVPRYLRSGAFYRSLSDDEDHDQQMSIPSNTLKADTTVRNNADLHHLLTSLRFWGVSSVQEEAIKYCLLTYTELEPFCDVILLEFAQQFPYVEVMISVLFARKEDRLMLAVTSGMLEIVRNLSGDLVVTVECCSKAARAGNLEILKCLHERGGNIDSSVLYAALAGGDKSWTCVQYLRAQGVDWPPSALVAALKAGSKECFHYALQNGCSWNFVGGVRTFYEDQYADVLKYAIQHGCPIDSDVLLEVVQLGAVKCLQVLHEQSCPWHTNACREASRIGHLNCLQYLHENGCPWDEFTVYCAVRYDNIECVQYALQYGCPVSSDSCHIAARKGYLPILQCLHEAGAPWDTSICTEAARNGNIACLQYAHTHGAPWDEGTFRRTFESGHLECLKYLLENGCPINTKQCNEVVKRSRCSQEAVEMIRSFQSNLL